MRVRRRALLAGAATAAGLTTFGPLAQAAPAAASLPRRGRRVQTGLEQLVAGGYRELRGQRVGIVTNPTPWDALNDWRMATVGPRGIFACEQGQHGYRRRMPPRYENYPRVAIITGSDSGIGEACAVRLAEDGFDVGITWSTDEAGAQETARKVRAQGRRTAVAHLDLTELPAAASVVDDLADDLGGLGVLVNNAGTGSSTPFLDMDYTKWRDVMAVDLDGPFLCTQRAARRMVDAGQGGRIINVTSVHEHAPRVGSAPYCAAKGGLGLFTQVLALELGAHGITANAIAPGEISTPMTGQEDVDPHGVERPGIPAGRPGDAREVAAVASFLASPAAAYVTGASYVVDGGMLLMGPQAGSHLGDHSWRSV